MPTMAVFGEGVQAPWGSNVLHSSCFLSVVRRDGLVLFGLHRCRCSSVSFSVSERCRDRRTHCVMRCTCSNPACQLQRPLGSSSSSSSRHCFLATRDIVISISADVAGLFISQRRPFNSVDIALRFYLPDRVARSAVEGGRMFCLCFMSIFNDFCHTNYLKV